MRSWRYASLIGCAMIAACSHPSNPCCSTPEAGGNVLDASIAVPRDAGDLPNLGAPRDAAMPQTFVDASTSDAATDAAQINGPSPGCGKAQTGNGTFGAFGTAAGGINRVYYFYVPTTYDASKPYPVIFRFHGYGGSGKSSGLEIDQASAGGALILSPNGLLESDAKNLSWNPNNQAADLALFDKLLAWVQTEYCVDPTRVFAYGFSEGGGFAQTLACLRGNVLRGVGTIAATSRAAGTCQGKVAGYLRYDQNDPTVPLSVGTTVRDQLLAQDGCSDLVSPDSDSCQRYTSCSPSESVLWCVTSTPAAMAHDPGGVDVATDVWKFFSALPAEVL